MGGQDARLCVGDVEGHVDAFGGFAVLYDARLGPDKLGIGALGGAREDRGRLECYLAPGVSVERRAGRRHYACDDGLALRLVKEEANVEFDDLRANVELGQEDLEGDVLDRIVACDIVALGGKVALAIDFEIHLEENMDKLAEGVARLARKGNLDEIVLARQDFKRKGQLGQAAEVVPGLQKDVRGLEKICELARFGRAVAQQVGAHAFDRVAVLDKGAETVEQGGRVGRRGDGARGPCHAGRKGRVESELGADEGRLAIGNDAVLSDERSVKARFKLEARGREEVGKGANLRVDLVLLSCQSRLNELFLVLDGLLKLVKLGLIAGERLVGRLDVLYNLLDLVDGVVKVVHLFLEIIGVSDEVARLLVERDEGLGEGLDLAVLGKVGRVGAVVEANERVQLAIECGGERWVPVEIGKDALVDDERL